MKTVHVDILPPKAILPILLFLLLPKVESDPKIQLKPTLSSFAVLGSLLAIFQGKFSKLTVIADPMTSVLTNFALKIDKSKIKQPNCSMWVKKLHKCIIADLTITHH